MTATVVRATAEHIQYVAKNCRKVDAEEIELSTMISPELALDVAFTRSDAAWCGMWDGVPMVVFGVARLNVFVMDATPWLIATDELEKHPAAFLRRAKKYFNRMVDVFDRLENYVWIENTTSIRWLKWIGFDMGEPERYGPHGAQFIRFWKEG